MFIWFIIIQILDFVSTLIGFEKGLLEANPLANFAFKVFKGKPKWVALGVFKFAWIVIILIAYKIFGIVFLAVVVGYSAKVVIDNVILLVKK